MMKKLVSLLLALILTLSLCTPVLAAPGDNEGMCRSRGSRKTMAPSGPRVQSSAFSTKTIRKHITVVQALVRGAV